MENQSFVIMIAGLKSAKAIKEKIMQRFNVASMEEYQLCKHYQENCKLIVNFSDTVGRRRANADCPNR
jgi:hypothetical protein